MLKSSANSAVTGNYGNFTGGVQHYNLCTAVI